jgi:hypothetical protein
MLRGYTCPTGCGGCCPRFTLDYLPNEEKPAGLLRRDVKIDDRIVQIFSDLQNENREHYCKHLKTEDGRCTIYRFRPFSCDFELIRFLVYEDKAVLSQQLFGRGWNMQRVDGHRGAKCEMTAPDEYTTAEVVRKLQRLERWAAHFGIRTRVQKILNWISSGDNKTPLRLEPDC